MSFHHENPGRQTRNILILAAVWAALAFVWLGLNATLWIVLPIFLTTLPAIHDLVVNRSAGMEITDQDVRWWSGSRQGHCALSDIEKVRLDTRFDLSLRVSLCHPNGKRTRLPYESVPKIDIAQDAFAAAGLATERHPFSLFG